MTLVVYGTELEVELSIGIMASSVGVRLKDRYGEPERGVNGSR
jgi:hypothetical protein